MPKPREAAIDALASRMRRTRAKGTSLDYDDAPDIERDREDFGASEADIKGAGDRVNAALDRIRAWSARTAKAILIQRQRQPEPAPISAMEPELEQGR